MGLARGVRQHLEDVRLLGPSGHLGGLTVGPLAPAIEKYAAAARAEGATIVLALVHAGGECARFDDPKDLSSCEDGSEVWKLARALPSGTVRLTAQAKGAGMISPAFATMLCFVQTDAALRPETADLLLGVCVKRSFDRVSVDGQLSTNDTAILMCSGASGVVVEPESEDELRFGEALDALLRALAVMLVADGEGAKRVARVLVRGGLPEGVEGVARAVANSPLVKAALHGGDPNWGRIVQAAGAALPGTAPLAIDVWIEGTQVCAGGRR